MKSVVEESKRVHRRIENVVQQPESAVATEQTVAPSELAVVMSKLQEEPLEPESAVVITAMVEIL